MARHATQSSPSPLRTARGVLAAFLAIAGVVTVAGLALLWPGGKHPEVLPGFEQTQTSTAETVKATVIEHSVAPCGGVATPNHPECDFLRVKLESGGTTTIEAAQQPGTPELSVGDRVVLSVHHNPKTSYSFLDMDRSVPLGLWLALTLLVVVAVGAWRGLRAIFGLLCTLLVIFGFLVPGLLLGYSPVGLSLVTGAAVLFPVIFVVHGRNWKSASALAGTLTALGLAALAAHLAIDTTQLRGLADENNLLIHMYLPQVQVPGIMLAGFIIGAVGVLNDVTIAQASTVQELYETSPDARPRAVFASAMKVGHDHIASMVYTLVLAYMGAALPLSMLLQVADRPLTQVLTSDVVATEIMRSSIGAIALVLAVPITTAIAAWTIRAPQPTP
ncbi:YibE/F family protein [Corynebacterium godavarianum]|uniref:YibE/F family protein n=1 Tax=Corynebacterium godavarianum TaxID=2054421 RepID=A0ABY3DY29_9CORY|nr:YibE/F family protein [Corynebacterium godavarianum]MBL7285417.1 YibE/F family protein [Corynebacterium godavarianum]TSJ70454.1 YibE/F family protein [Corynebacterium godavarianum]